MRIGRYLRVSSTEQAKALERQQYSLEQTVIKLGGVPEESPLFVDVQSGRDNDRPKFLELVQAIETRSIDVLVAYRVDRLARDLETSAWLGKLFERTGVKLYDFQKEGYVDFSNPEEWESYAHRSVAAESESRRLSKRISAGFEFSRYKGKAGSRPPWGYRRNPDTERYELVPELQEAVKDAVRIILEEENFQRSCRLIAQKWGKQWQSNGLRKWISNPVLRGHTGYFHEGRHWGHIVYNTHLEHAILSEEAYQTVEALMEERKQYWGANNQAQRHPLGGLLYCAKCGTKMCITLGHVGLDGHKNLYFSCRERAHKVKPDPCDMRRSLRVEEAEAAVIRTLIAASETVATLAQTPSQTVKSPRLLELENLLAGLNRLGNNAALQSSKDQIRTQMAELQAQQGGIDTTISENRGLLVSVFGNKTEWEVLKPDEKRAVFKALVDRVVVTCVETDTGEFSRRGKPKQIVTWELDVTLKALGLSTAMAPSAFEP